MSQIHATVYEAIASAISATPQQIWVDDVQTDDEGNWAYPADQKGRWYAVPANDQAFDLQTTTLSYDHRIEVTGGFSVACTSPAEMGRVAQDAARVCRAIDGLGCLTASDGKASAWRIESCDFLTPTMVRIILLVAIEYRG
jgi:hypothetical protein